MRMVSIRELDIEALFFREPQVTFHDFLNDFLLSNM